MASGVAAVVPDSGGILTYANNENAWTVNADAEHFAAAIKEAAYDNDVRKTKIANALQMAEANSNEAAIAKLFATYDRMYAEFSKKNRIEY